MTEVQQEMDMNTAILLTIEGASGTMSFWRSKEKMKSSTLNTIQKLRMEVFETLENDLRGNADDNPQLERFVSTIESLHVEAFGESVTMKLPYVEKAKNGGFWDINVLESEESVEGIRRTVGLKEMKKTLLREIAKLEVPVQDEAEQVRSILREREYNIKKGQDMFYGTLAVDFCGVNVEAASTCADVIELVRNSDPSGGMACVALGGLSGWIEDAEIATDPTKDHEHSWNTVREWERFIPFAKTLEMLAGTWDDFTEVDILAMKAGEGGEDAPRAIETLRQLLCIEPSSIPYSMRCHVRRSIVKEHNKRAQAHNNDLRDSEAGKTPFVSVLTDGKRPILTEDGEWPALKSVFMFRCSLHLLRNALVPYFKAKQTLEILDSSPLHLFRRQAIVDIGEMASHGHQIATNYLLDDLCASKDWSIKQIALGRAARLLPGANDKDKIDITLKLLSAALSTTEYGVVQETAETAMIAAFKGGLNRKPDFVDMSNKTANTLMIGVPSSSPSWAAWQRIQTKGFEGTVKPRPKQAGTSRSGIGALRAGYMQNSLISN